MKCPRETIRMRAKSSRERRTGRHARRTLHCRVFEPRRCSAPESVWRSAAIRFRRSELEKYAGRILDNRPSEHSADTHCRSHLSDSAGLQETPGANGLVAATSLLRLALDCRFAKARRNQSADRSMSGTERPSKAAVRVQ